LKTTGGHRVRFCVCWIYVLKLTHTMRQFSPEEYRDNHEAVFVESSSTVNLLAGVPLGSLDLVSSV